VLEKSWEHGCWWTPIQSTGCPELCLAPVLNRHPSHRRKQSLVHSVNQQLRIAPWFVCCLPLKPEPPLSAYLCLQQKKKLNKTDSNKVTCFEGAKRCLPRVYSTCISSCTVANSNNTTHSQTHNGLHGYE
jgi:hypothetical protein